MLKRFFKNEEGATAIEYVMIAGAMTVLLVAAMPLLTDALNTDALAIASRITSFK